MIPQPQHPARSDSPHLSDKQVRDMAELLYGYLALSLPPKEGQAVDAIIGFGHFDLRIAETCLEARSRGLAKHIIFTGGIGAGSADLKQPEAEAFRDLACRMDPELPRDAVIVESRSTNTGENVRFTTELLQRTRPELSLGLGIRSVILVATPVRMRRAWLTFRAITRNVDAACMPPKSDLSTDVSLFCTKGQDLLSQLPGEIDRLVEYPRRGWILGEAIPPQIIEASRVLSSDCKL